jgi:hypothetical protein
MSKIDGKDSRMQAEMREVKPLSLLIAVCDRGNGKKVSELFKDRSALFNVIMLGKGTANSKILNYLGLGQSDKTILFSVMPSMEAQDLLYQLEWTLDLKKPGHGIAFTLALDGICVRNVSKVAAGPAKEGVNSEMASQSEYELIIAVANRGYNQEVMDAARMAKATGGTIINARGFALSGVEKFFGVTLQSEKEIIMILAHSERKSDIMKAIAEKAGLDAPAGAVTFSMPVSDVQGLQPYLSEVEE